MRKRTRVAAMVAVASLSLGGVLGLGVLSAAAVPSSVTITTPGGPALGLPNPRPLSGEITWADITGGTLTVTVVNDVGTFTPCLDVPYTGSTTTTWNCNVTLEYGDNTITATATDADDSLDSAPIVIRYGGTAPATITDPVEAPGLSVAGLNYTFRGTGPIYGTVEVSARPVGTPSTDNVLLCTDEVDGAGDWACPTTFTDYRQYTISAQAVVITGGDYGPPDELDFAAVPQKPTAAVASDPETGLSSTTTADQPNQTVGSRWTFWPTAGTPQTELIECPAGWVAAPPPIGGATVDCDVAAATPGTYMLHGQGFRNDASSSDFAYLGRIPASPVISSVDPDVEGGADIVGTLDTTWTDPFGGVHNATALEVTVVVDGVGEVCRVTAEVSGAWACDNATAPAGGPHDFSAYATTVGFGGGTLDGYFQGSSPYGNTVSATMYDDGLAILSPADGSSPAYAADPMYFSGTTALSADVDVLVEGPEGFTDSCTATPDVDGDWICNISSSPTPPVGIYTATASQTGSFNAVSTFARILPTPEIPWDMSYPLGTGTVWFEGNNLYAEAGTSFWIEDGPSCTSPEGGYWGWWQCSIDLSSLAPGNYPVHAQNFLTGEPALDSVEADGVLTIEPVGANPPALTCGFSPNGGFSVSTGHDMRYLQLLEVFPEFGSPEPDPFGLQGYCNGSPGTPFPADEDEIAQYFVADCDPSCSVGGLEPGLYQVLHEADAADGTPGLNYDRHSFLFTIPEAPTITTAASTTNSVILSGTATPADNVRIVRPNGTALCTTTATDAGTWACQFPKSSTNSARAIAVDGPSGGMSAYSAARTIPVRPPATPIETLPEPFLVSWFLNFDGDFMNLKPGDSFTINVSGMPEGTEIEVWMHSTPRLLGTATGTGAPMAMDLTVPADIENGAHEIEMIAVTPLGTNYFFTSDAMVSGGTDAVAVDEQVEPTASPEEPGLGSGGGPGSGNRADPAAPSALSESVATLDRIVANPVTIAVAGGLALALLVLVALPTELLNNALSSNTSRLGRAYGVVDRAFTRAQDWFLKVTRSRALAAALLVSLVALIYGFVDPNFGFDVVSLRLVLSLAIAFFILSYGASWLSGFVTRRLWGVTNVIVLQPSILIFAILGVILARILDFSPGFLVGVAIGLELIAASKRMVARAVMVQFGFVVGLALAAWVGYSFFTPGPDFLGMLTEDMLVAVTAEGLTGALIAIFPLRFLDGREIWEDSRALWTATFLVVATAFALLVLPTAIEGTEVGDYGVWLAVLAAFGALSLGAWFLFARAARKEELAERSKVDA